jgi:hypothetical protein
MLESAGGSYTLTILDQAVACVVTGTVDPTTGVLSVDPGGCAPFFAGMTATATDTAITGTFSLLLCPAYTLDAAKVCGACDDDNVCTVDGCGTTACSAPESACTHAGLSAMPCDDGADCTNADTCSAGQCLGIPVLCDDGNPCTDEGCEESVGCVSVPNGNACNDGNACTTVDTCAGGACMGGPPRPCAPCERCVPSGGCETGPREDCRRPRDPTEAKLVLQDSAKEAKDRLHWIWGAGEATTAAEFGDPTATDDYTLCVFDGPPAAPRLFLQAAAPAGGACGDDSCWVPKGKPAGAAGFAYRDRGLLVPDGLGAIRLRPGRDGRARITLTGRGANLGLPSPMNVTVPVTVQLAGAHGRCFAATYTAAKTDREQTFVAVGTP